MNFSYAPVSRTWQILLPEDCYRPTAEIECSDTGTLIDIAVDLGHHFERKAIIMIREIL